MARPHRRRSRKTKTLFPHPLGEFEAKPFAEEEKAFGASFYAVPKEVFPS